MHSDSRRDALLGALFLGAVLAGTSNAEADVWTGTCVCNVETAACQCHGQWPVTQPSQQELHDECSRNTCESGGLVGVHSVPGPPTHVDTIPGLCPGGVNDYDFTLPPGKGAEIWGSRGGGTVIVLGFLYDRGQGWKSAGIRWDPRFPGDQPGPRPYPYAVPGALDPIPNNGVLKIKLRAMQRTYGGGEMCPTAVSCGLEVTVPPAPGFPLPAPSCGIYTQDGRQAIMWLWVK
jgi:hypothetical protein